MSERDLNEMAKNEKLEVFTAEEEQDVETILRILYPNYDELTEAERKAMEEDRTKIRAKIIEIRDYTGDNISNLTSEEIRTIMNSNLHQNFRNYGEKDYKEAFIKSHMHIYDERVLKLIKFLYPDINEMDAQEFAKIEDKVLLIRANIDRLVDMFERHSSTERDVNKLREFFNGCLSYFEQSRQPLRRERNSPKLNQAEVSSIHVENDKSIYSALETSADSSQEPEKSDLPKSVERKPEPFFIEDDFIELGENSGSISGTSANLGRGEWFYEYEQDVTELGDYERELSKLETEREELENLLRQLGAYEKRSKDR